MKLTLAAVCKHYPVPRLSKQGLFEQAVRKCLLETWTGKNVAQQDYIKAQTWEEIKEKFSLEIAEYLPAYLAAVRQVREAAKGLQLGYAFPALSDFLDKMVESAKGQQ